MTLFTNTQTELQNQKPPYPYCDDVMQMSIYGSDFLKMSL